MSIDFQLSGIGSTATEGQGITDENVCCAYGKDGLNNDGFDCLIFPNKVTDLDLGMRVAGIEQCGRSNGLVNVGQKTASGTDTAVTAINLNRTLCSKYVYVLSILDHKKITFILINVFILFELLVLFLTYSFR